MTLPYIDQAPLYNTINFSDQTNSPLCIIGTPTVGPNIAARRTSLPALLCPSNPQRPKVGGQGGFADSWNDNLDGGRTDYVGNMGWMNAAHRDCPLGGYGGNWNGAAWADIQDMQLTMTGNNGVIGWQGCVSIKNILDGTSNTLAVMEDHHWQTKANTEAVAGDALWMGPWAIHSTKMPINFDPAGDFRCDQWSSVHAGGAHGMLADGSVRFVSENVDWRIRQAVGTRNGNETLGEY
jgi:hypothetical protein